MKPTTKTAASAATFATEGANAEAVNAVPAIRVGVWSQDKSAPTDIPIDAIRMIRDNLTPNNNAPTYIAIAGVAKEILVTETREEIHGLMAAAGRPWRIGVTKR